MTEFMVLAALSEMVLSLKPPIKELFSPIGVTESGKKEKKRKRQAGDLSQLSVIIGRNTCKKGNHRKREKWERKMRNIFFVFTDWFVRFSYLLTGPDYFEESGMFKISPPQLAVSPGDIVYFLADQVCHRAPPPSVGGTRRVVFWFSWEATGEECSVPDVDFQLNPWTLYQLTFPKWFSKSLCKYFFSFSSNLSNLFFLCRNQLAFWWNGWIIIHTSTFLRNLNWSFWMTMAIFFRYVFYYCYFFISLFLSLSLTHFHL